MTNPTLSLVQGFKPNLNLAEGYKKVSQMAPANLSIPNTRNKDQLIMKGVAQSMMNQLADERIQQTVLSNDAPPMLGDATVSAGGTVMDTWDRVRGLAMPIADRYGLRITDGLRDKAATLKRIQEGTSNSATNSQHFYGKALDLGGIQNLDQIKRTQLVSDLYEAGFRGFGFGNSILHADIGKPRYWTYDKAGNWQSGAGWGQPIVNMLGYK